jgi:rRNA-processing protein FCF1
VLLPQVFCELQRISRSKSPKLKKEGIFALELAKKCKIINFEDNLTDSVDDLIIKAAKEWNATVFTNDKALRKKLRHINVPVIYVRQKKLLQINGRV